MNPTVANPASPQTIDLSSPGGNSGAFSLLESLALPLLDAAVAAAVACCPWVGRGDKIAADHAAVEVMRARLRCVPGHGIVVIGEGEKDEAPMLYEGEEVGDGDGPSFDLAIDPLEGTNLCASGAPGAITVLGAAPRGTLRSLSGFYMNKIVVGARARGCIDIDAPIEDNLARVAAAVGTSVDHLRVAVLVRPRHSELIGRIRAAGASVIELSDGDVMAGLAALVPGGGVDMAVGIGGAPEGVITACAVRALGGDLQGRLSPQGETELERVRDAGELDLRFEVEDLASSTEAVFAASGVTGSAALPGPERRPDGLAVHSFLVTSGHGLLRTISTVPQP